jgi:hypothetical protein
MLTLEYRKTVDVVSWPLPFGQGRSIALSVTGGCRYMAVRGSSLPPGVPTFWSTAGLECPVDPSAQPPHSPLLISGLSYKTAFKSEL